ncbi:TetR/AcrR family transcriptional regulator [Brachybacterium sp. ACRRE]|uniref:TetR/AcrR family transcriptional regulator n=1 Tax=Brachybacterium sp. ACRRE TaxID=2918184 RepID=UPI001EF3352E|nr:TetR/AcrR family transcriptional regulator [Brachybacterium sp. ACRRE]MCG7309861.1 TetR/AcrR family transcriptional regulator [Brachybacterium sp. ACRRE]
MESLDPGALRADARRNHDRIRAAAVEVFRDRGLSAPLEDIAAAAHVSKATVFNRFGGRAGLIDAVIDEVGAQELLDVIERARAVDDTEERIRWYVAALRDLQYRLPAVNGVILRQVPGSRGLMELCSQGERFHEELVAQGVATGVLAETFEPEDFQALAIETALVLEERGRPPRPGYDRRTTFLLDGIARSVRPGRPARPARHPSHDGSGERTDPGDEA